MIRRANVEDAAAIATIYNYYIEHTVITFEEQPVDHREMAQRIGKVGADYPWLVYLLDGRVVGYAYATAWRARVAYRYSAESTIYLDREYGGRGIGAALYQELMQKLRARQIHTAIGGIALPNAASVALHEKLGFEEVAHFNDVGFKHNRWIDVGYWQLVFDHNPSNKS